MQPWVNSKKIYGFWEFWFRTMRRLKKHRESDYCYKSDYGMHRSTFTKVIETGKGFKNFIVSVSRKIFARLRFISNFVPKYAKTWYTNNVRILPFARAIQKDAWILSECFCTVWTVWRDFSSKNVVKITRRSNARNTFPMSNTVFHFSLCQKWVKNLKKSIHWQILTKLWQ